MFNLFKKKENVISQEVEEVPVVTNSNVQDKPEKSTKDIIDEIHDAFNTAADKALENALKILNITKREDEDKVARLRKVGFVNTSVVKKAREKEYTIRQNEDRAKIIQEYKQKYPLYKFIFEEQVKEICTKYGLLFGEVRYYKGFVPEKNLLEIENFKLRKEDILCYFNGYQSEWIPTDLKEVLSAKPDIAYLEEATVYNKTAERMITYRYGAPLKICAPAKDMELYDAAIIRDGYKIEAVPDPVVLQPVKNGYLIVTAWGDEASDPMVVNETNN